MKIKFSVFVLTIIIASHFALFQVYAQEDTPSPTPVSYELSYPGLLPDNPFYFLKVTKDNIMAFFLGKPLDKAAFLLLQSDKQVFASKVLITQKKDVDLAQTTFANANRTFEEAVAYTISAQKEGMNIHEMSEKLKVASKKHIEVLDEIQTYLTVDEQQKFQEVKKQAEKLEKMSTTLKP